VPLAAEKKQKLFKPLFLDIGLCNRAMSLSLVENLADLQTVREGAMAEQFVGQELLTSFQPFEDPKLFYWEADKASSSAEVDFLTTVDNEIVPIEVKASSRGSLRSLHRFMQIKKLKLALRLSTREAEIEDLNKEPESSKLLSLPLYMTSRSAELCKLHREAP
jgi:predicted AAA+ superfamily ATPase